MGVVMEEVGEIGEEVVGGRGVERVGWWFGDGVGWIGLGGMVWGIEELMVVVWVRMVEGV